jgi:hypothetical protein
MHVGDRAAAAAYARAALPVMQRIGASEDEIQLRALLAFCALLDGRLPDAEDELGRIDAVAEAAAGFFGATALREILRAELALARDDRASALRIYRDCAARMHEVKFPGVTPVGIAPWALFGDAIALAAHARYADGEDEARGRALYRGCVGNAGLMLGSGNLHLDYPAVGLVLFALGAWRLLREDAPARDALPLLALAERFAYNRTVPTMSWAPVAAVAEEAFPGVLAGLCDSYQQRRPQDLLKEALRATERLAAGSLPARVTGGAGSSTPTAARRPRSRPARPAPSSRPGCRSPRCWPASGWPRPGARPG